MICYRARSVFSSRNYLRNGPFIFDVITTVMQCNEILREVLQLRYIDKLDLKTLCLGKMH